MTLLVRPATIDDPAVAALVREHHADMLANSPDDSMHALDLDGLGHPSVLVWGAWQGDDLVGIAALLLDGEEAAEVKSMRVSERFRGTGAGRALVGHLVAEAAARGIRHLRLETGSGPPFAPARALYAAEGFVECPPFGSYAADPHSIFMTRPV